MVSPLDLRANTVSSDGGWGYRPNQPSHVEPTCFAILALAGKAEYQTLLTRALASLNEHAQPDGSYRLGRGRPQAGNVSRNSFSAH